MSNWKYLSLLGASIALVPACGSSDGGASAASGSLTRPKVTATVDVRSGAPEPARVTVKAGEAVRFLWSGAEHALYSGSDCTPDGEWEVHLTKPPPELGEPSHDGDRTVVMVYEEPGVFDYFCEAHCPDTEVGRIVVE